MIDRRLSESYTYDGEAPLLVMDDEDTRIVLPEPDDDGYRRRIMVCCDCGLGHVLSVAVDHMHAMRLSDAEAEKVRAAVLTIDPSYFPLQAPWRARVKELVAKIRGHFSPNEVCDAMIECGACDDVLELLALIEGDR